MAQPAPPAQPKVSVASLGNPQKCGFLIKQGGSIKTWKKRWFVLKGDTLWYFKSQKELEQTGSIKLEPTTVCQLEPSKKKKGCYFFSVAAAKRTYLIYADSEQQSKEWVEQICKAIQGGKSVDDRTKDAGPIAPPPAATPTPTPVSEPAPTTVAPVVAKTPEPTPAPPSPAKQAKTSSEISPRKLIALAKGVIPFLQDEESKVLEFWQIWSESIPPAEDMTAGMAIEYHVSTSANMQKLTWRTAGPQNIFIQKMVDFFWNVGAPESEIDRLNDVGALINPLKIGSWIDMSSRGGMDGGWYFPVDISLKMALEAADPGEPARKVQEWGDKHSVDKAFSVGRDMGAAPPRQTEIRIKLPGNDHATQWGMATDAFSMFGFPPLPEASVHILQENKSAGICLSVIVASEGFVRLGVMVPKPSTETVLKLCTLAGANNEDLAAFEGSLGTDGPAFVEYQYLREGYGYGVYKEGFDIVFHYAVGEETADD